MQFVVKKRKKMTVAKKRDLLFYIALMAFPVIQFVVFYIVVNINSITLAFKEYDIAAGKTLFVGFENFKQAFNMITQDSDLVAATGTTFAAFALTFFIGTPLAILFSYYIYKKLPAHKFFRVMLFLPSIISAVVMVTIFQFFVEGAVPEIVNKLFGKEIVGLIENPNTRFATIIFYNIWISFGVSCLMYSDAMNGIPPDMIEAARMDGATGLKEFWHITLPMVYPTIITFTVVSVAGIFVNQLNLYSFFGNASAVKTWGYWLYTQTQQATSEADYPILSAMGLLFTVITVPLTLIVKKLLEKFGPKQD